MSLKVRENGKNILVYSFRDAAQANEVFRVIRPYFPRAKFVFEPVLAAGEAAEPAVL